MSFDEQHLRIENARLREEIDRISGIGAKYVGKPMLSYPNMSRHGPTRSQLELGVASFSPHNGMVGDMFGANDLLRSVSGPTEADTPIIVDLAVAAMEELIRMSQAESVVKCVFWHRFKSNDPGSAINWSCWQLQWSFASGKLG
ncbi:hypothetical protein L2E82_39210 [Cichorium intybus]|uniref:Uncharacterized protein n=1 Tax=Cichorium intybus TaxID=13427 RepID=A0ACB9AIC5_CICIN|nr:hypothetical protein L2E82_39210 [Cichorium intybus]